MVHVANRTWVRWESEGAPEMAAHLWCLLLGLPYPYRTRTSGPVPLDSERKMDPMTRRSLLLALLAVPVAGVKREPKGMVTITYTAEAHRCLPRRRARGMRRHIRRAKARGEYRG